jgi:hypothetical protein
MTPAFLQNVHFVVRLARIHKYHIHKKIIPVYNFH